jgi:hypothetical protein
MTEDGVPIRADIPLDHHPDSLLGIGRALSEPGSLGVSALAAAREAMRIGYEAMGRLNDAERDMNAMGDPVIRRQHPGGRVEYGDNVRMIRGRPTRVQDATEFIDAAERAFARTAPAIDRRMRELRGYRDTLAARVASAIDNPARKTAEGLALASEVRSHMKGMKRAEDRLSHAMRAVEAEDKTTVAAILHAPAYLSGLTDEALAIVRTCAAAKFAPLDSAQLDATEAAIRQVMGAGNALTRRFGEVLALRNAPAARAANSLRTLGATG